MTDTELAALDAAHALHLLRRGDLGALEYAQALMRCAHARADLHAMTHVDADLVRQAARLADDVPAARRGLLHGLPMVVKDNIDVVGWPCTAGSPALADHRPRRDADCVAPLRAAGAVVLGKCNLHEFALGVTSGNAAYGAVRNPHAPGRIAGGSSGGTAAAVAARLAPVGLGTDTGGSIRIPAALCGVVGFRPSTGRWPSRGVVPIAVPSRDTAAPMARSVADCALLDAVVCGEDPQLQALSPRGLRLGVPREFWVDLHAGLDTRLQGALMDLAASGVVLVPMTLDVDLSALGQVALTVAMYENLPSLRAYFADHGLPFDIHHLAGAIASPDVRGIFQHLSQGGGPDAAAYAGALAEVRTRLRPAWAGALARHALDALVLPTTPLPAARIGEDEAVQMDGRRWPTFDSYVRHCGPASILGLPSVSLPAGCVLEQCDRLPVGLMLDGPPGGDRRLLAIAAALQPLLPPTPEAP
jgi:Asp-tRNA(Asn)/Glu-tRNA(Gln) amidotransferase A subunit family amidase